MILSMANKTDIEKLQKKGMRALLNYSSSEDVTRLLNELGFLTVDREIKRDVLIFIYRIENNKLPGYLECLESRNRDVHGPVTRQMGQFHIKREQSSKGQKTTGTKSRNYGGGLIST